MEPEKGTFSPTTLYSSNSVSYSDIASYLTQDKSQRLCHDLHSPLHSLPSPTSSTTLPLAYSALGTPTFLLFLKKCQEHPLLRSVALSVPSVHSADPSLAQPSLPSDLCSHATLLARPSLTSRFKMTAILSLHSSSHVILLSNGYLLNEQMHLRLKEMGS